MDGTKRESGGIGLIVLCIIFNPIPGPIDHAAVAGIGGNRALKRL